MDLSFYGLFFEFSHRSYLRMMQNPADLPDLIIALSHSQVELRMEGRTEIALSPSLSVHGMLYGLWNTDHLIQVLDTTLTERPALLEPFDDVAILFIDRPHIFVPAPRGATFDLDALAGKYLRSRAGDLLTADAIAGDMVNAYAVPRDLIRVIQEYYSNAMHVHLSSVIWSALRDHDLFKNHPSSRVFFLQWGNHLMVLREENGRLIFSRIYPVTDQGDLFYYTLACHRLLCPLECWHITVKGDAVPFEMPHTPYITLDHHLELSPLALLVAHYRSCVS